MSDDQLAKLDEKIEKQGKMLDEKIEKLGVMLGVKINQQDKKIDAITEMLGEQNLKLYQHMEQRFDQLEAKIDTKADKITVDRIYQTLDGIVGRLETEEHERLALSHQVERHEKWITRLATHTKNGAG